MCMAKAHGSASIKKDAPAGTPVMVTVLYFHVRPFLIRAISYA